MGRLAVWSARRLCALLAQYGFSVVRRKGSHIVLQKRSDGNSVTVTVPDHKEIAIGTLQSIIRQSKLPRELFEE